MNGPPLDASCDTPPWIVICVKFGLHLGPAQLRTYDSKADVAEHDQHAYKKVKPDVKAWHVAPR